MTNGGERSLQDEDEESAAGGSLVRRGVGNVKEVPTLKKQSDRNQKGSKSGLWRSHASPIRSAPANRRKTRDQRIHLAKNIIPNVYHIDRFLHFCGRATGYFIISTEKYILIASLDSYDFIAVNY